MTDETDTTNDGTGTPDPDAGSVNLTVDQMLAQILTEQQAHRAEVAALKDEMAQDRARLAVPAAVSSVTDPAELQARRMAQINTAAFYCPGCGMLYKYERACNGRREAPHPAIEVVSTDELKSGDPSQHTAAPNTTHVNTADLPA